MPPVSTACRGITAIRSTACSPPRPSSSGVPLVSRDRVFKKYAVQVVR
jgi:hypothetical protein